ncbi:nucleosome assembly protein [Stylonychia lemnae]|uniref:Nucleosome assembly protein n=1 Tax=Stylonychia lemnae TaxID=5949 RepID=A0A078B3M1_STYLE|nr:nucleosome assembly protein [Stylonychia lemnae]|eukprot:CDW87822.1 nucleosome assembly protein [Stylonychia lemnae]
MPQEVQNRFKALKALYDKERELEYEMEQQYRELERKFELRMSDIYDEREDVLSGEIIESDYILDDYEKRSIELQDSNYFLMKVDALDIRLLQSQGPSGVKGFWYQAMKNHPKISKIVTESDKDQLMYLRHIETKLHSNDQGFDLTFRFDPNPYFKDSTLYKKYYMRKSNIIDEVEGCSIYWSQNPQRAGSLLKQVLQKKLTMMVESKKVNQNLESFFQFFKHKKPLSSGQAKSMTLEQEEEMRERMEQDYDYGLAFKDQLIPLALEYYLGAMGVVKDLGSEGDNLGLDSTELMNYDDNMSEFEDDPKQKSRKKFEEINQMFAIATQKGCNQQ